MIVCITGMPGAGKSTIVSKLQENGFVAFTLGDGVRSEAERRNLEPTGENLGKIMLQLIEKNAPLSERKNYLKFVKKTNCR